MPPNWETLTKKNVAKRIGQLKTKVLSAGATEYRYSEYTDPNTGEKVIRLVPVISSIHGARQN